MKMNKCSDCGRLYEDNGNLFGVCKQCIWGSRSIHHVERTRNHECTGCPHNDSDGTICTEPKCPRESKA